MKEDQRGWVREQIVHLARLALAGRPQDVQALIARMARRLRESMPDLAAELQELLRNSPSRSSPLRSEEVASVPVDADSRLQLVRIEHVPMLDHEPIWSPRLATELAQIVAERKRDKELLSAGLTPTRTVVFTGPPGVGKTFAARWVARELGRPLLILDLAAVMSSFLGRTGSNLRSVLDYAKGTDCVLLLDEIDAIAKRRDDVAEIGELKRLVTVLLQEIDDWPATGLLIAATNHADLVDSAAWRRFELRIDFPMPGPLEVEQAMRVFLGQALNGQASAWGKGLAVLLRGTSFSDIEREVSRLRREALLNGEEVTTRVQQLVRARATSLDRTDRLKLASALTHAGLSQRRVHELTGVSRDTLRAKARASEVA